MTDPNAHTLNRYLSACEARDPSTISACFAPNARICDPTGEFYGIDSVREYFETIYMDLAKLVFETRSVFWCNSSCAVEWEGKAIRRDGTNLTYQGIDVFTFNEETQIVLLWAFWTPLDLVSTTISHNS